MSHLFHPFSLHALMGRQKNSTAPIDLALFDLELHLSRTGGPGRRDDGGTAPCGRWPWPSACGSRGPCCADASWADRYEPFSVHLLYSFSRENPQPQRRKSGAVVRMKCADNSANAIILDKESPCQPSFWEFFFSLNGRPNMLC